MRIHRLAFQPFQYFGQCDRMRCDKVGEDNWQNMIAQHQKVPMEEFQMMCDHAGLLEDESLEEFIADDPDSYFAKSMWGNKECYFLMTNLGLKVYSFR